VWGAEGPETRHKVPRWVGSAKWGRSSHEPGVLPPQEILYLSLNPCILVHFRDMYIADLHCKYINIWHLYSRGYLIGEIQTISSLSDMG